MADSLTRPIMRKRLILLCLFSSILAISRPTLGQVSRPGEADTEGRIFTKISVRTGGRIPGSPAVPRVSLLIVADKGQRQELETNDAGDASLWLFPAQYRLATRAPVTIGDRDYSWDMVIQIRAGSARITLAPNNATHAAPVEASAMAQGAGASTGDVFDGDRVPDLWSSVTLAYGAMACGDCKSVVGGPSGSIGAGKIISSSLLVGLGATGWIRSQARGTVSVASLDARVRFYPAPANRFFFTAGAGVATLRGNLPALGRKSEFGPSGFVEMGFDVRIAENVSLTPSLMAFAAKSSTFDAFILQPGIGITVR